MSLNSFTLEGQILLNLEDLLSQEGQRAEDFGLDKKINLTDEIASSWVEAKIAWDGFIKAKEKLSEDKLTSFTRDRWILPLLQTLGYKPTFNKTAIEAGGKSYVLSHSFDENPDSPKIHVVKYTQPLDKKQEANRFSPHAVMQNFLNDHEHLWGIVTNGMQLRLLRDSTLIGHSSYLEINLEQIMSTDSFAEFMVLYRVLHRTRFPKVSIDSDNCYLERYYQKSLEQGGRVREELRFGVERAIEILGKSILSDENNIYLQKKIEANELDATQYYRSILNLIYKMLFLMVAESRNLLFVGDDKEKKRVFDEYYSFERLRELAEAQLFDSKDHYDLWESFKALLKLLDENFVGKELGLSPVDGGLFSVDSFRFFHESSLKNESFLEAIRELSLYQENKLKKRVNYSSLDVEELGSVYEGLLEYHPHFEKNGRYTFALLMGAERKSTASYYTGAELVEEIIAATLDPLIEKKCKSLEAEKELLALRVVDPACGSGHFLLAATRRIAKAISEIRAGEDQPTPESYRRAKREVIAKCIHGVDLNPLAVDLCKVALWIEGYESGRPLSFLDHKIKCGNSLVGVFSLTQLERGIPSDAYTALATEDKKTATALRRQNEKELLGFQNFLSSFSSIPVINLKIEQAEEKNPDDVHRREKEYLELRNQSDFRRMKIACDLWTQAFFSELTEINRENIPLTNDVRSALSGEKISASFSTLKSLDKINPFHWPIEFSEVIASGGFDAIVGNPPWEKLQPEEKKFFISKDDKISSEKDSKKRAKMIDALAKNNSKLFDLWNENKKEIQFLSRFIQKSGRFKYSSFGNVNLYRVFVDLFSSLMRRGGRAGIVVQSGLVTDEQGEDFFKDLVLNGKLDFCFDFDNTEKIFEGIDSRMKFCLIGLKEGGGQHFRALFNLKNTAQMNSSPPLEISKEIIKAINPNKFLAPIVRNKRDLEILFKIYNNGKILKSNEPNGEKCVELHGEMYNMSRANKVLAKDRVPQKHYVPLLESKYFNQYDHRFATFAGCSEEDIEKGNAKELTENEKKLGVSPFFRYYVEEDECKERFIDLNINTNWMLVLRKISSPTNERTLIATLTPAMAVGNSAMVIIPPNEEVAVLVLASLNSFVLDFVARAKVGNQNINLFIVEQLPMPRKFNIAELSKWVAKAMYTDKAFNTFFKNLPIKEKLIEYSQEMVHRASCKIDAYIAKCFNLTRNDLEYILDPSACGEEFSAIENFGTLKNYELKKYNEYKTKRLVLEAWDELEKGSLSK